MNNSSSSQTPSVPLPSASRLRIGVARRCMTPPVGIYARQWGAALHDVAEGVHRPLCATAMAFGGMTGVVGGESEGKGESAGRDVRTTIGPCEALLVVIDAGWWHLASDEWRVRGALVEELGLDVARVMVSCTHTHAACSLCTEDADKPGGEMIAPYLELVRKQVLTAAREAIDAMCPAVLTWGWGRCELATNRDFPDPAGGRVVCGYNPSGTPDQTLLVGRVTDEQGLVSATLVNYACHPTTLAWDNRLISPDYVGAMREIVENATGGAPCLFLQGASGELSPREQYTGDVAIADQNGRLLGYDVMAALETMLPTGERLVYGGVVESGAPLATWRREPFEPVAGEICADCIEVDLPLKPMPSEAELKAKLEACSDRTEAERIRRKIRVVRTVGSGTTCPWPVWIWRIGPAIFVGQANEAYSIFQVDLRKRFPGTPLAVMNLVNGSCGYLSPPELHDQDIYQVWQSPFDRQALPVLTQRCVEHIEGARLNESLRCKQDDGDG